LFLTTQNNDKFNKSIYHQNNALKQQGAFIWGRVWRYQRSNQNPYIEEEEEEEETTQLPKENEQRDKQRSTKQTYKTKDRVTKHTYKTKDRSTKHAYKTKDRVTSVFVALGGHSSL
jgi:hypothetical protein